MAENIKGRKIIHVMISFVYLLSPFLVLSFLCAITGHNLFLAAPTWSDELDYWREIFSFSENGFSFGGSLFAGYDASIGPMGGHSFSPILVWGLFSIVFPWTEHSILIINLFLLSVAWLIYYLVVKPEGMELAGSLALAFFYSPLTIYLCSSMMEVACYAGLIVFFSLYKRCSKERGVFALIFLYIAGMWCMFTRITYVVVLFPAVWMLTDYKVNFKTVRNMFIYVVVFLCSYKLFNLFCADYPDWVTSAIAKAPGIGGKIKTLFWNIKGNLYRYFYPGFETRTQVVLRYAFFLMILALLLFSFVQIREGKFRFVFDREYLAFAIMTGGLLVMMVCLYDIKDWRDYRTFAPVLFLDFLFVFSKAASETKQINFVMALSILLILAIFSKNTILIEGRQIDCDAERCGAFDNIASVDEEGTPAIIAATFDINWGDYNLMRSIPSQFGFQVFYNNVIDEKSLLNVDYILTTTNFAALNQNVFEDMTFIGDADGYGIIYKVR